MIAQVALTAIGIPVAMEGVSLDARLDAIRAKFPSREYVAARIDVDPLFAEEETTAFEERRARTFAEVERRVAQEPGVVAVTFADRAPGGGRARIGSQTSVLLAPARVRLRVLDFGGGARVLRGIRSAHRRRPCVPRRRPGSCGTNGDRQRGIRARLSTSRRQRVSGRRSSAVFEPLRCR
jgi:hypothetical protein